jgi:hypothetical protein
MSSSVWTQADLDALDQAIAKGVKSVKYTDKEIVYRTLSEMLQLRDFIKNCLTNTSRQRLRTYASTSKDLA